MRIYLKQNYREVYTRKHGLLPVLTDRDVNPKRFYVDAPEDAEATLQTLDMLEDNFEPRTEVPVEVPKTPEKPEGKKSPELKLPESYMCKTHQREHKRGSSQYAACFGKNHEPAKP